MHQAQPIASDLKKISEESEAFITSFVDKAIEKVRLTKVGEDKYVDEGP